MKIINLKCSNCGAKLKVESNKHEYTCEYCNTVNILDDEIIKVEHSLNDTKKEEKFKIADTYLEDFENYEEAYEAYEKLSKEYPYEAKVWIQLIRSKTRKYQLIDEIDESDFILCDEYMKKYLVLEKNEQEKNKNIEEYEEYKNNCIEVMKKLSDVSEDQKIKFRIIILLIILIFVIIMIVSV